MDFYRHLLRGRTCPAVNTLSFGLVYFLSILFTFQSLLTAFNSSTYLERFTAPEFIGLIYATGAFFSLLLTFFYPVILGKIGNYRTTLVAAILLIVSLFLIGLAHSPLITILAFVVFQAISPLIYINLDVFIETLIGTNEGLTGSRRGAVLALMSLAAFIAPLVMGQIIGEESNLHSTYYAAALVGVFLLIILTVKFRCFIDPIYEEVKLKGFFTPWRKDRDLGTALTTQFLLQFFYTWAIIYFPLYLSTSLGFSWLEISYIIAAGLSAFVIFEYPIGLLADRYIGEKEMMALGFVILAIASSTFAYLNTPVIFTFMVVMFCSRIGASLVEVTTESYFFKKIKGHDANLISLFRLTRPLANLIGALAGFVTLYFLPLNLMFIVLGFIMALGAFLTLRLKDTK